MSFSALNSFLGFLARSLALLEAELPQVAGRVAEAVGPRNVSCVIGDERFTIQSDGRRLRLSRDLSEKCQVEIATTRAVIRALLEGETTLEDALWQERILLKGGLEDILAFNDGLHFYLCGAVRSPSFPDLMSDYLRPAHFQGGAIALPLEAFARRPPSVEVRS